MDKPLDELRLDDGAVISIPNNEGITSSKGKEPATDAYQSDEQAGLPTEPCYLSTLPPELVDYILSFLSPVDLAAASATCRDLYRLATDDNLWQAHVQANVPGVALLSPPPVTNFRHLYAAHDLCWFLPKYKLWFCDRDLTGRLIVARYDPRTGNIEGYQLLATSRLTASHQWQIDDDVIINSFEPQLKLHIDRPIFRFEPTRFGRGQKDDQTPGGVTITRIPVVARIPVVNGVAGTPTVPSARSNDVAGLSSRVPETNRFRAEMPLMNPTNKCTSTSLDALYSNLMLARPLSPHAAALRDRPSFPYGNVWPPPVIPADHRVAGTKSHSMDEPPLSAEDLPSRRAEMSDRAFRIRTWVEMRSGAGRRPFRAPGEQLQQQPDDAARGTVGGGSIRVLHIGEQISTYATLDPALYTPTARYPYRGIWVGDYSGHGCEFLLIHQPEREDEGDFDPDLIPSLEGETDEDYAQRKTDATVYRGRLEAIKLTGDPNVPRGEYTFLADDLGPEGYVRTINQEPFHGARVVRSRGHVAGTGFVDDKYMDSQLILTSHDRLAQYWLDFGHISLFERVNIDEFTRV